MSWKQLSCPVLLCLWLVTFISFFKFGSMFLSKCLCLNSIWKPLLPHLSDIRIEGRGEGLCLTRIQHSHPLLTVIGPLCGGEEVRRHSSCKLAFHPASECGSSTLSLRNYIYSAFLCGHDPRRHLFKSSWGSFLSSLSTITLW